MKQTYFRPFDARRIDRSFIIISANFSKTNKIVYCVTRNLVEIENKF